MKPRTTPAPVPERCPHSGWDPFIALPRRGTSGVPAEGVPQPTPPRLGAETTAAAAQTSPLRGEAQRERARPTRTITMPRPRPRACDDTLHARRRRVASSTWGDIAPAARAARHYVTRRQPCTHPPSLEPLQGHQGYWVASAPGASRLPCRVTSTCTCTTVARTTCCRSLLIRLFATPVGGADRCKTRRCTRAGYLPSQLARIDSWSCDGGVSEKQRSSLTHGNRHPTPQRRLPQPQPTSVEVGDFLLCPPELELDESSRSRPLSV